LDGVGVHFIHARGAGDQPLPLVLTHGYPDSFVRFLKIIPMLTEPAAHGGDAEDAFDCGGDVEPS
jgi:microsomal epoxide hydrolase